MPDPALDDELERLLAATADAGWNRPLSIRQLGLQNEYGFRFANAWELIEGDGTPIAVIGELRDAALIRAALSLVLDLYEQVGVDRAEADRDRATDPRPGDRTACAVCGHDIECVAVRPDLLDRVTEADWRDRGAGTDCLPYEHQDPLGPTIVTPPEGTKHRPVSDR